MTRLEFLEDTVKWYSENPKRRCADEILGGCFYSPTKVNNSETTGCAIGRHLTLELALKLDNFEEKDTFGTSVNSLRIFNQLPDHLKKLGKDFLSDIQHLHDTNSYWTETGLSEQGTHYIKTIKNRFEL